MSRFYYAAFSVLTQELAGQFGVESGQETPNHKAMSKLIQIRLVRFTPQQRRDIATLTYRLYSARVDADYKRRTTDAQTAQYARRDAVALLDHLGVDYDN